MYINHVWKKKKIKLYIKPRRAYFFKAGRCFHSNLVHLLIISMTKKRRDKKHKKNQICEGTIFNFFSILNLGKNICQKKKKRRTQKKFLRIKK